MEPIRVMLVDDHALFRKGLASLLAEEPGFEVVGQASDGQEALEKAAELMPDVIVMDVYMPRCDGLTATRQIKARLPYVRIVILTVSETDRNLFEAVKAGAMGYLVKKIDPADLYEMLRRVARGEAALSATMAAKVVDEFGRLAREDRPAEGLTAREREVLELVAKGATNKEIGAALHISENTVRNHMRNILEKLHLQSRTQAAAYAVREGLVEDAAG
ncbi:MAG: response regulator transcription factor [Armatimonadetes bacterium]|nr:response regulator transcription factor [Armatimonadota bacterium]